MPDWSISRKLSLEKDFLGVYVSGHPLDPFRAEMTSFGTADTEKIQTIRDGREVRFGGIVAGLKVMNDKRGNRMAFATLEDFKGSAEVIIFSDNYEKGKAFIIEDKIIMVTGRVSTREGEAPKVIATDVYPLDVISSKFKCQLVLKLPPEIPDRKLNKLQDLLDKHRGNTPLIIAARRNGREYYIRSNRFLVSPQSKLLLGLKELLGDSSVFLRPI